jgi:hypothetical protein
MATLAAICLIVLQTAWTPAFSGDSRPILLAAAPQGEAQTKDGEEQKLSPEEKMNRRFPQPVKVGDLVGLPLLDYQDSTIGFIRQVVQTPDGKIQLIFAYGRWLGWVRAGGPFDWNRRLIALPLEVVAILGRQVDVLDMSREEMDKAPDVVAGRSRLLGADDTIKIALGRR